MHRGNIMSKLGVRNQGQLLKEYFSSPNGPGA
jgi:DNA-binding CsgD family transcriptional regulator